MAREPVDIQHLEGLVKVSGLSLTDDELASLAAVHAKFGRQRAALSEVFLGETEPAITITISVASE